MRRFRHASFFDQVPRRLRERQRLQDECDGEEGLEGDGEAPLDGAGDE